MSSTPTGGIHHIELWVPDIDRDAAEWGWLLTELGATSRFGNGRADEVATATRGCLHRDRAATPPWFGGL